MIGEMGVAHFLSVTQDLGIDILLPNKEEGSMLTGGLTEPEEIAAALAHLYPMALIMLKLDADGALRVGGRPRHAHPRRQQQPRRCHRCGDLFAGGFLSHYLEHGDAVAAARFATTISRG